MHLMVLLEGAEFLPTTPEDRSFRVQVVGSDSTSTAHLTDQHSTALGGLSLLPVYHGQGLLPFFPSL